MGKNKPKKDVSDIPSNYHESKNGDDFDFGYEEVDVEFFRINDFKLKFKVSNEDIASASFWMLWHKAFTPLMNFMKNKDDSPFVQLSAIDADNQICGEILSVKVNRSALEFIKEFEHVASESKRNAANKDTIPITKKKVVEPRADALERNALKEYWARRLKGEAVNAPNITLDKKKKQIPKRPSSVKPKKK